VTWHTIDWSQVHRNVRRLQARIVKATQEGRWGKVKALQHLLTHSFSGKALAVRRVTENHGKTTAGVDRVIWNTPEKKAAAVSALTQRGYHPQPVRRVYIPKRNGKKRPLGIATMHDRAMQTLYLFRPATHRGDHRGRELVWVQTRQEPGRCHRAMSPGVEQALLSILDPGR
jgi:RNA-directed DNA polymerase